MKIVKIWILIGLLTTVSFAQTLAENVQKMAELVVSAYNAKDYAQIEQQFNSRMRSAISGAQLKEFLDNCHKDFGKIVKLGTPDFVSPFVGIFPVDFEKTKMDMVVALDGEGRVAGLSIEPPTPVKPKNTSRNKTGLALPFRGEWFVFWGGDTIVQNYHQGAATQRFAFDILKVDAAGKTHKGDGKVNEDYYAFGQEILADADGTVTDVITGVRDNVPGVMNPLSAVGNMIMIRHANGEVSVFAHIKYDSTRVRVGQQVKKGELLGLCGNSGNSSEAHLHYQVQGTSLFEAENSMKVFFEKVMVKREGKSEIKTEYSPVKGDIVSPN